MVLKPLAQMVLIQYLVPSHQLVEAAAVDLMLLLVSPVDQVAVAAEAHLLVLQLVRHLLQLKVLLVVLAQLVRRLAVVAVVLVKLVLLAVAAGQAVTVVMVCLHPLTEQRLIGQGVVVLALTELETTFLLVD